LSLGDAGVILHLGQVDPTLLRNRDSYICLRGGRGHAVELALVWKLESVLKSRTVVVSSRNCVLETPVTLDMAATDDGSDLPGLLQSLLVSVERAIERVPLDALAFPCPRCRDEDVLPEDTGVMCACQCVCQQQTHVEKKDTSIQTSPMFEIVGSIPHIDSDEETDAASEPDGRIRNYDVASRGEYRFGTRNRYVRFEVFTAVTMKNGVFWDCYTVRLL
jgi:hypothetical protein